LDERLVASLSGALCGAFAALGALSLSSGWEAFVYNAAAVPLLLGLLTAFLTYMLSEVLS